jgi:hypothetical protein
LRKRRRSQLGKWSAPGVSSRYNAAVPQTAPRVLLAALLLNACIIGRDAAAPVVRTRAAKDLECPDDKITIESQLGSRYVARGCGKSVEYNTACEHLRCEAWREGEQAPGWRDRPDPGSPESLR